MVGGGPGDPGLITVRGAALLASADVVLHDELLHPALLDSARPDALIRFVGKRGGNPQRKSESQAAIDQELVSHARQGRSVVRLKGGDPFLFGRGSEEAEALVSAGIPFEVVPGVTSAVGAAAYAGISLTHRDMASSVTFLSGTNRAGVGFDFSEVRGLQGTLCIFMGMRRLDAIAHDLMQKAERDPETPTAVIEWGTRPSQRVVTGPLHAIAERVHAEGLGSPGMIIVGAVATLRDTLRWFDKKPLFGRRILVTRALNQARDTAETIRERGGEALLLPTISIQPPPDLAPCHEAIERLSSYDAVLFTSENGVEHFLTQLGQMGYDARAFGVARIAAIGPGTAAALGRFGLRADIVPKSFVGEELAASVLNDEALATRAAAKKAKGDAGLRFLLARARVAREVVPELLRAEGHEVDVVAVYETQKGPPETREQLISALSEKTVDIVLLTSSSTVDGLLALLGDGAKLLSGVLLASIGPITTRTAEGHGLRVDVTSSVSTIAGLLDAIEAHLCKLPTSLSYEMRHTAVDPS